jgi:flagellar hook-basal body complex protein FliE
MNDPLGFIGRIGPLQPPPQQTGTGRNAVDGAPGFKQMLQEQIDQVNQLQTDANIAIEDLAAGRRDDVETVIIATQKADIAFRMLLQVRNKVMEAYDEVKQLRI